MIEADEHVDKPIKLQANLVTSDIAMCVDANTTTDTNILVDDDALQVKVRPWEEGEPAQGHQI